VPFCFFELESRILAAGVLASATLFSFAATITGYLHSVFPEETRLLVFDETVLLPDAGAYGIKVLNFVRSAFQYQNSKANENDLRQVRGYYQSE
jgi:hypothetical protein